MSLFGRKEVSEEKAEAFASWFVENADRIRASVENRIADRKTMLSVLDEVEAQLYTVYRDGYRGQIQFEYGGKDDDWELRLFHRNRPFLIRATGMIAEKINAADGCVWTVRTSK